MSQNPKKTRKTMLEKFIDSKYNKELVKQNIFVDDVLANKIEHFFAQYDDYDRYGRWKRIVSRWIENDVLDDWVARRQKIDNIPKGKETSLEWYCLVYGDVNGVTKFNKRVEQLKTSLPNNIEYYLNNGSARTIEEAVEMISEFQSRASKQNKNPVSQYCVDYWVNYKGYSEEQAKKTISEMQTRDRDFYIKKYGKLGGIERFVNISIKKRETWKRKTKDELIDHAMKTRNRSPKYGLEHKALTAFIFANNIDIGSCLFGAPYDQFTVNIEGVGVRRYDLAIYNDNTKTDLKYIVEFHGFGHINFSDYDDTMKDEIFNIDGKILSFFQKTYGEIYYNDLVKRNFIEDNYPNVKYIVIWFEDYKNKRLLINELV